MKKKNSRVMPISYNDFVVLRYNVLVKNKGTKAYPVFTEKFNMDIERKTNFKNLYTMVKHIVVQSSEFKDFAIFVKNIFKSNTDVNTVAAYTFPGDVLFEEGELIMDSKKLRPKLTHVFERNDKSQCGFKFERYLDGEQPYPISNKEEI